MRINSPTLKLSPTQWRNTYRWKLENLGLQSFLSCFPTNHSFQILINTLWWYQKMLLIHQGLAANSIITQVHRFDAASINLSWETCSELATWWSRRVEADPGLHRHWAWRWWNKVWPVDAKRSISILVYRWCGEICWRYSCLIIFGSDYVSWFTISNTFLS